MLYWERSTLHYGGVGVTSCGFGEGGSWCMGGNMWQRQSLIQKTILIFVADQCGETASRSAWVKAKGQQELPRQSKSLTNKTHDTYQFLKVVGGSTIYSSGALCNAFA